MSSQISTTVSAPVARLDDLAEGTMRMARVGEHRIALIRTGTGVYAIDNACPHQGYGLVTGALQGDLVTCQWHNWKYRVSDGVCVVGEEDVRAHPVAIVDGEVVVSVTTPSDDEQRAALWPSLRRGVERDYPGQIARDVVRLLHTGAEPADIIWDGLVHGCPRAEDGVGHEMAVAADCLALTDLYEGDERALPLVHGLAGISEETRDRPARTLPDAAAVGHELAGRPAGAATFAAAIEAEDGDLAVAALVGAVHDGVDAAEIRRWFIAIPCQHHLSYGHGAIYTQKAFELLEHGGWERALDLLPHLALTQIYATREDTLPYMRKSKRALDAVDLDALAAAPSHRETGWTDAGDGLRRALLDRPDLPAAEVVGAVLDGAGIEGLLHTVTLAASERLLHHNLALEFDPTDSFRWLDLTHTLTYSRAARWAWELEPGPDTARLALFAAYLIVDSGRGERRSRTAVAHPVLEPAAGDVGAAVLERRPDDAVCFALGGEPTDVGEALVRAALADRAGSFIVAAHLIKTAQAAREEAAATRSPLPLAAAARFLASPRQERFVSSGVTEAIHFLRTGSPPPR